VLVNLIRNAFEALSQRGNRLVIRSSFHENQVEVAVIDNGPGIDADVMQRLFRPYATSKPGGMGLGLTISQHIVRAHQGRISVTTSDNGTCFVITLPC
jgi:two-component system sensor kinase FixL